MTELAAELALHQTTVSRALALLELPAPIQERVEQGVIAPERGSRDRQARSIRGSGCCGPCGRRTGPGP